MRDLAAKLRVTAALLGCASQKDLCARFHAVNPATEFDLDRSYKWMQGRAQPRSVRIYEDWATLLDTPSPITHLQSCTIEEFVDLVCERHQVSRAALAARADIVVGGRARTTEADRTDLLPGDHLVGAYACYSHAWSPYFEGRIIRSSLVIEAAAEGAALAAVYREMVAFGAIELRGPVRVSGHAIHLELSDAAARFQLTMWLFVPGTLANVLAGVMSGTTFVDADPQPAATRIVMIRVPEAGVAALDASNRYLDPTEELFSSDLRALGLPVVALAGLDTLLEALLRGDHARDYIKLDPAEYSRLALAMDRLFIENNLIAGARGFPAQRRAPPAAR